MADRVDQKSSQAVEHLGFSGKRASEIVGISYRQLDYWARTDLIRPSIADAAGSGSRRAYGYTDLLELKVIKTLLDAGIGLKLVREVFAFLRTQLDGDIASANIVIGGKTSVLVRTDGELIDVLKKGQGVLNVLPLGGMKEELDTRIVSIRPILELEDAERRSAAAAAAI